MLVRAVRNLLVAIGMLWFLSTAAGAGSLSFANHTSKRIYLAIAVPADCSDGWVTTGWYIIEPGYAAQVLPALYYDFYYFYATDGDIHWGGDADGCVDYGHGNFLQCSNCPPEFNRVTMQQIDTPGYDSYIFQLFP